MIFKDYIRFYDLIISFLLIIIFLPCIFLIYIFCFIDTGKPFFIQKRVGINQKPFEIIKFRTMYIGTPSIGSHLIDKKSLTRLGRLLRFLKIDELPQLINVIKGEMSLIGPRPCLYNQKELIDKRKEFNIFSSKPGITGLAQIKGLDMSDPVKLVQSEYLMISTLSHKNYFKYLFMTFCGMGFGDKVKQ